MPFKITLPSGSPLEQEMKDEMMRKAEISGVAFWPYWSAEEDCVVFETDGWEHQT